MEIIVHLGAHGTGADALLRDLRANRTALAGDGICVPEPGRTRTLVQAALRDPQTAPGLTQRLAEGAAPEKLVLWWDGVLCAPRFALGQRRIYPMLGDRAQAIAALFPGHALRFSMAICNPATFIPALHDAMQADLPFAALTDPVELDALTWSEALASLRQACPEAGLTAWCSEDGPLIWPEVLGAVTGHSAGLTLTDTDRLLASLLRPGGLERLRAYLHDRPDLPADARRKVIAVFLEKLGDPAALEAEFDLPGWTDARIWELTRAYEMDLPRVAEVAGLTLLRA